MKKILSLTLLLVMSLMVFTFLPARAEDDTSVNIQLTATPIATSIDSSNFLEKIPSLDQLKYFKVMKKENGSLYGVRLQPRVTIDIEPIISEDGVELEKIPSPDQLKYFKVMKKENGALYGIRLRSNASATNITTEIVDDNVLGNKLGDLEKIASPQLISLYEKIQKIGTSLWGVKKSGVSEDENNEVIQNQRRLVTSDMIECVSKVIDTKDNAIITITKNSAEKVVANINTRGICQKDAIASAENQIENLKECVVSFQKNYKDIINNVREEQKDVWVNYKVEMKACALNSSVADNDFELMIDDGGNDDLNYTLVQ